MDSISKHHHEKHPIFSVFLRTQNNNTVGHEWEASNSDFPIAIALLAIMAMALLVVSYYIFVIKCCLNWQTLYPLRRFWGTRHDPYPNPNPNPSVFAFSHLTRGLDEWLINNIPAFQFKDDDSKNRAKTGDMDLGRGCTVCLNDFHDQEMLRVLPRCNHLFHLDCIDVWLLNNASCPLCRSSISGRTKYPIDQITAPSSSPQEEQIQNTQLDRERSVSFSWKTEQSKNGFFKKKQRIMMGDECINSMREKDDEFEIQNPIRRSFSMDDRGLYLQVQDNLGKRSHLFSFGHGRGSRTSSVIPIQDHT